MLYLNSQLQSKQNDYMMPIIRLVNFDDNWPSGIQSISSNLGMDASLLYDEVCDFIFKPLNAANFGKSTTYPPSIWSNYVNEIYTKKDFEIVHWTNGSQMFGQFHVLGKVKDAGWMSSTRGILYAPDTKYDFSSWFGAFPNFNGTFYVEDARSNQFSLIADINLNSRARLGRGWPGGIVQPLSIPWIVLGGTLREI